MSALTELVAKWRAKQTTFAAWRFAADELEAALATPPDTTVPVWVDAETDEALNDAAAQLRADRVRDLFVAHYARCRVAPEVLGE